MKLTIAIASLATASAFTSSSFMGKTSITNAAKSTSSLDMKYKVAVVGGGPAGACAAEIFTQEKGIDTVLFERKLDNAKPCGGAIPLCMVGEFDIPETVVDRKVRILFWIVEMYVRCQMLVHGTEARRLYHLGVDHSKW